MQAPENGKDWFRIENNADDADATDVLIYSSIGGWFGMWADEFVDELKQVTTSKINLRLNSPGGSVFDGIAIANAIRSHPATVTVYVDSLAASIASVIAMSGDRLVMMPQSQIMVHNASGACYGDATEMTKMADLLDKQSRNIAEAYAQHTGGSLADWQQYMADETWFTAEEALAVGLADEVMPMRPKKGEDAEDPASVAARMQQSWDLSMYRYPGRIGAPTPKVATPQPVAAGALVTAASIRAGMANQAQLQPGEIVLAAKTVAELSQEELVKLITDTVRAEIAAAAPPFPPKEDEDEEDEDEEEAEAENASDETPSDEARVPEGPGEEQQIVPEGAGAASVEQHTPEEIPPDDGDLITETYDQADDTNPFVGLFHATSPLSADDVFAQLKEGW
jgi:ATP-dependent protease ClpP protease subunit/ribosomal protein L12E/L44/L45/RPP1/RPP2